MQLYSIDPECRLGPAIAAGLGQPLARRELRTFDDGEHKLRPLEDPAGEDVYVIAGLHGGPLESPRDKLVKLLMFVATLRDHGAGRVTAVIPYLAYARKDRRTQPWDPLGVRHVAQMLEAMGTQQVVALEVHQPAALENALRCPLVHLDAQPLFDPVVDRLAALGPIAVASPDPGGVKRALAWREALERRLQQPVGFAMVDKRRSASLVSTSSLVAGDVTGLNVLLRDDLVATGQTLVGAAAALRRAGARGVTAFACHGLFVGPAVQLLADPHLDGIVVSDSVPPFRLPNGGTLSGRITSVPAAPALAQAIRHSHATWVHRA